MPNSLRFEDEPRYGSSDATGCYVLSINVRIETNRQTSVFRRRGDTALRPRDGVAPTETGERGRQIFFSQPGSRGAPSDFLGGGRLGRVET